MSKESISNNKRIAKNTMLLYFRMLIMMGVGLQVTGSGVKCQGSGDRYLNHLYTIEKWHVQQESIQIAESITLY